MSDGNLIDKGTERAESTNRMVYSIIALFATLIVAAAFCNGAANLGLGKTLGDGYRSIGAVISDVYCAAIAAPEGQCPGVGESISAWWDETKREQGLKLAGVEESQVPGAPPSSPSGVELPPSGGNPPSVGPTTQPPVPVVTGPPQGLIEAIAQAERDWQAYRNPTASRQALVNIEAAYPNDFASYAPAAALKAKIDAFDAIWKDLQTRQEALWDGKIADAQEFLNALNAFKNACEAFASATADVNPNPAQSQIDTCRSAYKSLVALMTAYVDATEGDASKFAETVTPTWHGTTWTITEYDDRAGSCRCATLTATGPQWIDGLILPNIPTQALNELFPDQTGPLTDEVGQEITWP